VALSRSQEKRALAQRLGAGTALDTDGAFEEQLRELTAGAGAAAAMDFTGVDRLVARLVRCTRRGGRLVMVGYTSGTLGLPYAETVMNGIDVMGSRSYTREDVRVALGLMQRRKVDPLVGKTAGLEDVDRALDWIADASVTGRVVVTVD
jgi:D-arabinose 1-dehydrogenase-like Zn-dependent alcohol dehydrogenase